VATALFQDHHVHVIPGIEKTAHEIIHHPLDTAVTGVRQEHGQATALCGRAHCRERLLIGNRTSANGVVTASSR
jgi:hypothetical protein